MTWAESSSSPGAWALLALKELGHPVEHFSEVDSTNNVAKLLGRSDPPVKVYLADFQTHGRGRFDRTWTTSQGDALLGSWSFQLQNPPGHLMAPVLGLDLWRSAIEVWPQVKSSLSIKPPNDLYLGAEKVAGLLVEAVSEGSSVRLVVGLGFNVKSHPITEPPAGDLQNFLGEPVEPDRFKAFIRHLTAKWLHRVQDAPIDSLSDADLSFLTDAIRRHPIAGQGLIRLHSQGDIEYTDRLVAWQEL